MAFMATDCVFHGDRYSFDILVRDMRKGGLITRQHAKVIAMTVCTCRKKVSHRQPISEEQARAASDNLLDPTLPFHDKLSLSARDLVTSATRIAAQQTTTSPLTSQTRLTVLLHQILQDDFRLLEEEEALRAADYQSSRGREATSSSSTSPQKTQQRPGSREKMVKRILAKKKRKYTLRKNLVLPMFGGATRQLFAHNEVGVGFSTLRHQCACVLELDAVATATKMAANLPQTVVKAWCSSESDWQKAAGLLTSVARAIQAENSERWRRRRAAGALARYTWFMVMDGPTTWDQEYKENLTEDYEKKMMKKQSNGSSRTSLRRDLFLHRGKGSPMAQGHCLHCLLPFWDFKADCAVGNGDVKHECRHHPGYVTGGKWTCCLKESDSQHPTREEHAQNGCRVGRHRFRPHKKAERGVGIKANRYSPEVRFCRLSLEPHTRTPLIY
ncbi:uncharacterized protein LOC143277060 [Babylonia areolata]|uniref:uncharacterized protein LOC143277060 n=1 Tax=Babylonia areolata TaxID=304850 RepID=UPI003FD1D285